MEATLAQKKRRGLYRLDIVYDLARTQQVLTPRPGYPDDFSCYIEISENISSNESTLCACRSSTQTIIVFCSPAQLRSSLRPRTRGSRRAAIYGNATNDMEHPELLAAPRVSFAHATNPQNKVDGLDCMYQAFVVLTRVRYVSHPQ